ncbi:MAG: hypothetical protein U5Q44_14785 [Dehalococcoidia bacterium]|nr:hypothetical protein [Dehalococcoidia bacterium]
MQEDQSNVEVRAGTEITLREALEAVLVASGNNVAEILARWDTGTIGDFVEAMNARAAELGMEDTTFTDVSGLDDGNVSTATDLLTLAREAMGHPVFAEIVGMEQADLPVVGVRENTNVLLGQDGFIGIKTGQTEAAGACLVWAVELPGDRTLYGVVLGQPERDDVFAASADLAGAAPDRIREVEVIDEGERVGSYTSAWGGETDIVAAEGVSLEGWAGDEVSIDIELEAADAPIEAGEPVGTLVAQTRGQEATVELVAEEALQEPGAWWRLTHN